MQRVAAATRQPDSVAFGAHRQAEPALPDCLTIDDSPGIQIDERQLMGVVAGGGCQCVTVVSQSDDVERQVGQGDVLSGGLQGPAVGKEKAVIGRAGVARGILGYGSTNNERAPKRRKPTSRSWGLKTA